MIIVLKPHTTKDDVSRVENMVKKRGLDTHIVQGKEMTVIGCIGDTAKVDSKLFEIDSAVDKVMHVQEPYKLANRAFHPEDSIINVSGVKVGGDNLAMIAGPCSVESYEQVLEMPGQQKLPEPTYSAEVHSSQEQALIHSRDSGLKVLIS